MKIAIAEPSVIIRTGLEALLKRLSGFRVQLLEVGTAEALTEMLRLHHPDLLIANPSWLRGSSLPRLKEETGCSQLKSMALLYVLNEESLLCSYDERIYIYDSPEEIRHKVELLYKDEVPEEQTEEQQVLSLREKEIVVCVVKGLTNREIADKLYLSTHTVITHRRNIARKLQIHSASGLTIYAIVNKLVELSDINN